MFSEIIFILIIVGVSKQVRSLTCNFSNDTLGYECRFSGENIQDESEMLPIFGEHKSGLSNDDVRRFYGYSSTIKIFPSLIIDQFLYLESVSIYEINIEQFGRPISRCDRLSYLNMNNNNVTFIPGGIFQNCRNFRHFSIANNQIRAIDKDAFIGTDLGTIYLMQNQIITLHPLTFTSLINLESLLLSWNQIESVHVETFRRSQKLLFLGLGNNKIQAWTKDHLPDQSKLWSLYLDQNQIKTLDADTFVNAPDLRTLALGYNFIEEIPEFEGLEQLESFQMFGGKVKHLSAESFKNMKKLKYLTLSYNLIVTVNFTIDDNENFLPEVKDINLNGNRLTQIPKGSFQLPLNVEYLYINSNQLTALEADGIFPIDRLRVLSVEGNKINKIEREFFTNAANLSLNLKENRCWNGLVKLNNSDDPIIDSIIESCSSASTYKISFLIMIILGIASQLF